MVAIKITAPAPDHIQIGGISSDQHHAIQHAIDSGLVHTGVVTDTQHGIRTLANAHAHAALQGVTSNDHHDVAHTPESHTGQGATAAELETLTDGSGSVSLHTHISNPAEGTQAAAESESTLSVFIRPERLKHSPGVAKVWANWTIAGVLNTPSYNVASLTDVSLGVRDVVFDVDFSTSIQASAIALDPAIASGDCGRTEVINPAVGSVRIRHFDGTTFNLAVDEQGSIVVFGDQ